jgi:hypothetical protein
MDSNTNSFLKGSNMKITTTAIAGAVLLGILIFGCAGTPELDANWGRSFEEAKVNQTLNPDSSGNLEPVEGLQGPVAEKNLEELLKKDQDKK